MPTPSTSSGNARRPPRACYACARRKVSCDKRRPSCSRCFRAGIACQYAFGNAPSAFSMAMIDETPTDLAERMSIGSRLERLGEFVSDLDNQGGDGGNTLPENQQLRSKSSSSLTESSANLEDPGVLHKGVQTKARYLSKTSFALINDEISAISDLVRQQQRSSVRRPVRTSAQVSESSSQRSGGNDTEINAAKQLYGDIFPHVPQWPSHDFSADASPPITSSLVDIVADLPTRAECETLIWVYMTGYHTMKPLFHGPTFLNDVKRFQRWMENQDADYELNANFVSILAAVIFAGCAVCSRPRLRELFGHISREKLSSRFYSLAVSAIRLTDFPRSPSLQSMAAFIIVDVTWLREEQPLTCCAFVGVAFRVAQMLGLHKEASKFADVSATEIQVRRQLWWNIITVDAQVAFASGLPPLIESRSYDVEPVSELSDALFTEDAATHGFSKKSILGIFIGGKFNFFKKASDFLRLLHSNRLSRRDLDDILALTRGIKEDMEARKAQITSIEQAFDNYNQMRDSEDTVLQRTETNPLLGQFTKTLLSMFAAKPYAIMYGPLQRHKLLSYLREKEPNAIGYCREYLQRFLILTQREDFQPWHWCWPGQHQPLHSIMALIKDLEEFPSGPLARETRKLVDLALTMTSEGTDSGGIFSSEHGDRDVRPLQDGGNEAWKFVRKARDKCWEKAGLDPAIYTCPEDANDINFDSSPPAQPYVSTTVSGYPSQDTMLFMLPPTGEEWSSMGYVPDLSWDFGNMQGLDFDDQSSFH